MPPTGVQDTLPVVPIHGPLTAIHQPSDAASAASTPFPYMMRTAMGRPPSSAVQSWLAPSRMLRQRHGFCVLSACSGVVHGLNPDGSHPRRRPPPPLFGCHGARLDGGLPSMQRGDCTEATPSVGERATVAAFTASSYPSTVTIPPAAQHACSRELQESASRAHHSCMGRVAWQMCDHATTLQHVALRRVIAPCDSPHGTCRMSCWEGLEQRTVNGGHHASPNGDVACAACRAAFFASSSSDLELPVRHG
jgi:hypothetical protein